jgi:hypothetical protein
MGLFAKTHSEVQQIAALLVPNVFENISKIYILY